jgi:hypothetical protein
MDFDGATEDDITRLLEEIPLLYKARAFADGLDQGSWFSHLGEPLDEAERALARLYLDGLGFPEAEPAELGDWEEAAHAAETLDRDAQAWEAEELLRAGLVGRALERMDETAINTALAYVAQKTGEAAKDMVEDAAAYDDGVQSDLLNAAAGALAQAANAAALAVLAEAEEDDPPHPALARWRLFERGRWPVGLVGSTLNIL